VGSDTSPRWFKEALATASVRTIAHTPPKLISPVAFFATKHVAFLDRGNGDFSGSPDIEDFVTVIDGRENIAVETENAPSGLRAYVISAARELLGVPAFIEALPGYLPGDRAPNNDCRACEVSCKRSPGSRRDLASVHPTILRTV
jgi:hypothetical protein